MKTILVVEDSLTVRTLLTLTLEKRGYRVISDDSGAAALRLLESAKPDLLILDIHLPEVDGIELITSIRIAGNEVPIIAISGGDTRGYSFLGEAEELGANAVLPKPIDTERLLERVAELL